MGRPRKNRVQKGVDALPLLGRIGLYAFVYIILAGISLYHYYLHYDLLQSGKVLSVIAIYCLPPVFICFRLILLKKASKAPLILALFPTLLTAVLLLGLIPFINSTIGTQDKTITGGLQK